MANYIQTKLGILIWLIDLNNLIYRRMFYSIQGRRYVRDLTTVFIAIIINLDNVSPDSCFRYYTMKNQIPTTYIRPALC